MALNALEELKVLLRARYNLIYVVTYEENRLQRALQDIANEMSLELSTWSFAEGLRNLGTGDVDRNLADPEMVIEHIRDLNYEGVFLLKDFHPFLGPNGVGTIRALRDFKASQAESRLHKSIIISSPVMNAD